VLIGTAKAGVFSERQASVVADQLIARHGPAGSASTYDGKDSSTSRRNCCWPTRLSSGPAAYGAGSTVTGLATEPTRGRAITDGYATTASADYAAAARRDELNE
jgi:hypothetical protein